MSNSLALLAGGIVGVSAAGAIVVAVGSSRLTARVDRRRLRRFGIVRPTRPDDDGLRVPKAHGDFVDHDYTIERDGDTVAEVSKKWFRARDTYGVDVYDENATALVLSITVAIDALSDEVL